MNSKVWAYVGVIFAELFWASSFVFTQQALGTFSPVTVVVARIVLATLLLLGYCIATKQLFKPTKAELRLFALAAFFQPFVYFILEAYGLQRVNPNTASLVLALGPQMSPFLAYLILRERVSGFTFLGLLISAVGIILIVLWGERLVFDPIGIILLVFAALTTVLYCICLRKVDAKYKPASIVFWIDLTSIVMFLPAWAIMDWGKPVAVPETNAVVSILVLAVFCSVASYIFFCNAIRYIGVARANAFSNLIPALTPLCVWALTGDLIAWNKYVGIFIVILGLYISQNPFARLKKSI